MLSFFKRNYVVLLSLVVLFDSNKHGIRDVACSN